jgi:hypothetical protein
MFDYVLATALLGFCLFWGAWRDYANGNARDSKLMAVLGMCTVMGSAGMFISAS